MLKKSCGCWPIWYLLFFCHGGAEGQLQWIVKEKVTDYGQNLTLFCPVKNCCSEGAGWSVGSKTLIVDVKAFSNNPNVKYHGTYNTDGFGVVIRNLSEADLNVTYRCVYDFNWSTSKYLLHGDVFKESTDVFKESTEVPDKDKENNTVVIEIVGCSLGAFAGIAIIIGIIVYCMRRKNKKQKSKGRKNKRPKSKGTDEEMTPFNDSDNQMDNQPGRKMKRQNSKGTGEESKSLTDSINLTENQQGTGEESKSLTDSINLTENQQGTGEESKSLTDSINLTENQQGTGEESKSLTDSINLTENQQDDMAEAESNTVKHSDAQVVLEPLDAVRAIQNSRLAVESELRIALVGKTGVGKSATANTICGKTCFDSGVCGKALTKICQQEKVNRHGRDISIIDTPGIFDAEANQSDVEREIKRCVHLGAPGLHAILFIMGIGRVTQEDITTIQTFLKFFGNEMENRVIVVFTHGDKLQKEGKTLLNFLETIPEQLKTFLENFKNRFLLFNNDSNEEQSKKQALCILKMIEALKTPDEYGFYIDEAFRKAEERVQQKEEEIRNILEKEYNEKIEEFKRTMKSELQEEIRQEYEKEINELNQNYEKKLCNIREEVRKEIKSEHNAPFWL